MLVSSLTGLAQNNASRLEKPKGRGEAPSLPVVDLGLARLGAARLENGRSPGFDPVHVMETRSRADRQTGQGRDR
jgi:hypothetical protein